jgi:hypothetical protein
MKEPPPHPVWRSKLALLAWMINKAIDNGNYEIAIADVRKAANEFRVMELIREEIPSHYLLDLSMFTPEDDEAVNHWFYGTNGNHDIHVENKGLCLLLAWTIEMMQHAWGTGELGITDFRHAGYCRGIGISRDIG